MRLRYKKVLNDLKSDLAKNLMLVLAIAIGVFGIGTILGGYAVLKREMARNYLGTNPASATIKLENVPITRSLVDSVKAYPDIKTAERRATIYTRMKIKNDWYPLLLFVIDDFRNMQTNTITHISGSVTPTTGSMLIERTALSFMQADVGENVLIKTPHIRPKHIIIAGTVHDPGLAPAGQQQTGYGYVSLQTLQELGEAQDFDELRIVLDDPPSTVAETTEQVKQIAISLEKQGYKIHEIQVPPPRKHPHQGQLNAILSLFTIFSFMILILSSILVAASISTLMAKQVREIGIMKTIGANSLQITTLYIVMILLLSAVAIIPAILLSGYAAAIFYTQISALLNLAVVDRTIPAWVFWVQILSGVFVPLVVALFPVIRGGRVTVREALDNNGVPKQRYGKGFWEDIPNRLHVFSEAFTLSIRNVFRKRSRLMMSLSLLAAGGAMFMTALNVSKAWDSNLLKIYQYRRYDLEVRLNNPITTDDILAKLKTIPGIDSAEPWAYSAVSLTREVDFEINHSYPDKGHGSFILMALPAKTDFLSLPLQMGNWLSDDNADDVVLNQMARSLLPGIGIGDHISLSIDNTPHQWRVAGFVEDVASPATAFVPLNSYRRVTHTANLSNMIRISYDNRSFENARRKTKEIENLLSRENISVAQSLPVSLLHNAMAEHMGVLVNSLLAISILMGLVGALGLMSAMGMNVIERTREIGILRAIGAQPKKIRNLVINEGLLVGIISILLAFSLSLPLSYCIGRLIGDMAFRTPLPLTVSSAAIMIWVMIILVGSIAATIYPAGRAAKITIREALSYE